MEDIIFDDQTTFYQMKKHIVNLLSRERSKIEQKPR